MQTKAQAAAIAAFADDAIHVGKLANQVITGLDAITAAKAQIAEGEQGLASHRQTTATLILRVFQSHETAFKVNENGRRDLDSKCVSYGVLANVLDMYLAKVAGNKTGTIQNFWKAAKAMAVDTFTGNAKANTVTMTEPKATTTAKAKAEAAAQERVKAADTEDTLAARFVHAFSAWTKAKAGTAEKANLETAMIEAFGPWTEARSKRIKLDTEKAAKAKHGARAKRSK